jgi:hypothetical protein
MSAEKEKKEHKPTWLRYWNPGNDAGSVECLTSLETIYWCFTPANQIRTMYRAGELDNCRSKYE